MGGTSKVDFPVHVCKLGIGQVPRNDRAWGGGDPAHPSVPAVCGSVPVSARRSAQPADISAPAGLSAPPVCVALRKSALGPRPRGEAQGGPVHDGAGTAIALAETHGGSGDGGWAVPSTGRVMRAAGAHRTSERHTGLPTSRQSPSRTEDQIDDVLRDSFPASDPPPWTLGTLRRERRPAYPSRIWRILRAV